MELYRRTIFIVFAVILCAELMFKGHGKSSVKTGSVAFLHHSPHTVTFRLAGDVPGAGAGVYSLPVGATLSDVIIMTFKDGAPGIIEGSRLGCSLHQGDIVTLTTKKFNLLDISVSSMSVRERMLLGIPLVPDQMDVDGWEALPGIGPKLARAIVDDRQNNGDFGSLEGLKRVPGVGEKLLHRIVVFFYPEVRY